MLTALGIFILLVTGMILPCSAEGTLPDVFDTGFRITVNKPSAAEYQPLNDTNVTLDFYRIAMATPREGQDVLDVEWGERFKVVGAAWEAVEQKAVTGEIELKAADIDGLAQGAARIVLADVPEYESTKPAVATNPDKTGTLGTAVELGDEAGIYLIIAHGSLKDYKITGDDSQLSTAAVVNSQLYQFAPMLVTVPNKGVTYLEDKGNITGVISGEILAQYSIGFSNTLSEASWIGDVEIIAKVGREDITPDDPDDPDNPDDPDDPDNPGNPDNPGKPGNGESGTTGRHKTGDNTDLTGWFALLLIAGAGGGAIVHRRRRREN